MQAAQERLNRLFADLGEKSPLTVSPFMTTLLNLIYVCLRRLLAPLRGAYQPAALVLRAQAATFLVALFATTGLTPAHPIHAPTLKLPA